MQQRDELRWRNVFIVIGNPPGPHSSIRIQEEIAASGLTTICNDCAASDS